MIIDYESALINQEVDQSLVPKHRIALTADVHVNVSSRSFLRFLSSFPRASTWNVNTNVPPLLTNILFQVRNAAKS